MIRRTLTIAFLGLFAVSAFARADSLVSLPEPDYPATTKNQQQQVLPSKVLHLVYPTIGFPSLVAPGEELTPVIFLPGTNGSVADWRARLESGRDLFMQTVALPFRRVSYDSTTQTYRLAFEVPAGTPEDTFDLVIESAAFPTASKADAQPNAVRVLRARSDYDLIHIADTQIRDPTTQLPQKFAQLLEEIRLRDPAFTLYSGDLNFGADYTREYPENWGIMRQGGVPLWCAPGNHDGYSWLADATTIFYDGLSIWRRTLGPTYFSFRYGRQRFIAANSYGGTAERRNSYTFLVHNPGGDIEAAQLSWIEQQARQATAAGDEALLFLHHNPHTAKSLTPSVPGYPWSISLVGAATGVWNGPASRDELTRILGEQTAMRWVLAGHTNNDEHLVSTLGSAATSHDVHYVNTTSPCNGGWPREGYRVIGVRGGRIAELDYQQAQPSVPFPLGGNLAVTFLDPNDGQRGTVRARVTSILEKPVDVTLKVFVRPDPRGYRTSAGVIREVGLADVGVYVVYLRVSVPAKGSVEPEVSADPQALGARPALLGGSYNGSTATGAAALGGGRAGGGGACGVAPRGGVRTGAADAAASWLLVLAVIALASRGRRLFGQMHEKRAVRPPSRTNTP